MVLPLIIGAIIIIGGSVAIYKGSDTISPAINRIFNSKEKRDLELQKQQQDFKVSKRGVLDNTFAFIFGESAYAEILDDRAKPQAPLTGEQKNILTNHTKSNFTNNRTTRFSRNG